MSQSNSIARSASDDERQRAWHARLSFFVRGLLADVTAPASRRASFEYIPSLDGMRAIAILIVIGSHFGLADVAPGGFGVTLFFFISGLLITRLLIAESSKTPGGKISIYAFYVRRFLRLAPALLTLIAGVSLIYSLLVGPPPIPQVIAAVFYFTNYFQIFGGYQAMPLGQLWSLAVEEHYYLVFPVLFSRLWQLRTRFLAVLLLLAAAALVWRAVLVFTFDLGEGYTHFATDTRIDSILYGAVLAVLLELKECAGLMRRLESPYAFLGAALLLAATFLVRNAEFRETARYTVQGITFIPIFFAIIFVPRFALLRAALANPILVWIGKLSYSLYLWHLPAFNLLEFVYPQMRPIEQYSLAVVLSFAVASLSYYGIEKRFLALRQSFRRA
jgi:peptidoglycan/LPS O-acetylase OafA/YrhL